MTHSEMDKVEQEVEKLKKEWNDTYNDVVLQIKAIENYGKSPTSTTDTEIETKKDSLPRLKGLAQDGLSLLNSLQFKLDLFAPQLPTDDQVQSAKALLESWKNRSQSLRVSMRNANLQANENIRKAAQKERELLLGGGGESKLADKGWHDICRRKHHREPQADSSANGSGGGKKRRHTHDFRGIYWSTEEG